MARQKCPLKLQCSDVSTVREGTSSLSQTERRDLFSFILSGDESGHSVVWSFLSSKVAFLQDFGKRYVSFVRILALNHRYTLKAQMGG